MTRGELYKNKLAVRIMKDSTAAIKSHKAEFDKAMRDSILKKKNPFTFVFTDEKELYIKGCFDCFVEIMSKLEALEGCSVLINSYPKSVRKIFRQDDYIKYHVENYVMGIIGVFDRCLLLVNKVYILELDDKDVILKNIRKAKKLKDTEILKVLDVFDQGLHNIREVRNLIAHRGRFSDTTLREAADYETLLSLDPFSDAKSKNTFENLVTLLTKQQYSKFKREQKKRNASNNSEVIKGCGLVFDALYDTYVLNSKKSS